MIERARTARSAEGKVGREAPGGWDPKPPRPVQARGADAVPHAAGPMLSRWGAWLACPACLDVPAMPAMPLYRSGKIEVPRLTVDGGSTAGTHLRRSRR